MINFLQKFCLILILFLSKVNHISCLSSIPLAFSSHPNIQSRMVDVLYSSSSYRTATITYSKPKATVPNFNYIFVGLMQMDYDINTLATWNAYVLYYSTSIMIYSTFLKLTVSHQSSRVSQMTFTVLIFDNQFPQRSTIVDGFSNTFTRPSNVYNFPLQDSNYTLLKFIRYIDLLKNSPTQINLNIAWNDSYSSPTYTAQLDFTGNYQWAYVGVKFLAIYPPQFPPYPMLLQTYTNQISPPPYTFYLYLNFFNSSLSNFIFGLSSFAYVAVTNSSNQGFTWNSTFFTGSNYYSRDLQISLDDQFTRFNYNGLFISILSCTNPLYGIRHANHSTGSQQCFDQCYQGEYIAVSPISDFLICLPCSNFLCKTCEGSSRCSSCITFYDMDENGGCTLNTGYYIDSSSGSNVIYPCSNSFTNCLTCDSIGSICNTCNAGYYLSGSSCTTCTSVATYCTNCSSTQCFKCQSPYILINQTLCSSPLTSPPPPLPVLPCFDTNCMVCSQPNVTNCLLCISNILTLINGECIFPCGDGLIAGSDICDDGNNESYDGCSSDCKRIQDGFSCDLVPSALTGYSKSNCYFNRKIQLNVISITKSLNQNKLSLILKNKQSQILAWKDVDFYDQLKNILVFQIPRFSNGIRGYGFNYNVNFIKSSQEIKRIKDSLQGKIVISQTRNLQTVQSISFSPQMYEYILLEIWYNLNGLSEQLLQSLSHQQAQILFNPSLSQRGVFTQSSISLNSIVNFDLITDDNHMIQFYSSDYYENVDKMYFLSIFISILTILIFLIGVVSYFLQESNSKQILMALQTVFIVQLTYFSLYGIGQLNPLFIEMAKGLKYSTGYQFTLRQSLTAARQLKGIDIQSANIENNVNISLAITVVFILIGVVIFALNKLICKGKISQEIQQYQPDQYSSQKQQTKQIQTKRPVSQKIYNIGSFLLFNLGFALVLFFMYKFIVFSCFQLQYQSFSMISLVIIGVIFGLLIGYSLLFVFKLPLFNKFTQKIHKKQAKMNIFNYIACIKQLSTGQIKRIQKRFQNYIQLLPDTDKPLSMKKIIHNQKTINPKLWYIVIILIQHYLNSFSLALMGQKITYNEIVPIVIYIFQFGFVLKHKFYEPADLGRLQGTYLIGIVIQVIFLIRSILMNSSSSKVGVQQTSIGIYFPYSIIILLIILCLISLAYIIYSLKKVRCCQLQIEWQRLQLTVAMKLKLQSIVKEQMQQIINQQDQNDLNTKNSINILNNESLNDLNDSCKDILKDQYTSLNSSNNQEQLYLPVNIRRPVKGILAMITEVQKNKKQKKLINLTIDVNYENIEINQQVTTKQIKKEIKDRLSNQKISQKIRSFGQQKMENILALKMFTQHTQQQNKINQKLQQSKTQDEPFKVTKSKISPQISNIFKKLKQTHQNKNQQDVGYIYTDREIYDTHEEYDMI